MTNESTEQGVREAVARCIIGPRNRLPIGSAVTLDQLKQIRWDSATSDERADALWAADAILATLSPDDIRREEACVPAGYALVPIEPTREMWAAGGNAVVGYKQRHHDKVVEDVWSGMLAAAIRSQPSREGEK